MTPSASPVIEVSPNLAPVHVQSAAAMMMTMAVMTVVVTVTMIVMVIARLIISVIAMVRMGNDATPARQNQTSQQKDAQNLLFHTHYF